MSNKIVRTTVNNFYNNILYSRDCVLYEHSLSREIAEKYLNESYHVSHTFDKCIYDIIKNVNNNQYTIDKETYSGWSFDSASKSCNTQQIGLPIYIKVINVETYYNDMSITDRDKLDDGRIHITVNLNRLSDCNASKRAVLAHEFRHAIEMYADPNKSHINDKQINYQDLLDLHISDKLINDAIYIAILFSLSEERARIDSVIHYLEDNDNKIDNDTFRISKKEIVAKYIDETKELHLLYNMIFYIDELYDYISYGSYMRILLVGYFLGRIGNTKFNISKDMIIKMEDNIAEQKSDEILKYLENNKKNFMLKLSDCIATHIVIGMD